jgi:hypothetical protein
MHGGIKEKYKNSARIAIIEKKIEKLGVLKHKS